MNLIQRKGEECKKGKIYAVKYLYKYKDELGEQVAADQSFCLYVCIYLTLGIFFNDSVLFLFFLVYYQ